jgi:hypothetical protein
MDIYQLGQKLTGRGEYKHRQDGDLIRLLPVLESRLKIRFQNILETLLPICGRAHLVVPYQIWQGMVLSELVIEEAPVGFTLYALPSLP